MSPRYNKTHADRHHYLLAANLLQQAGRDDINENTRDSLIRAGIASKKGLEAYTKNTRDISGVFYKLL